MLVLLGAGAVAALTLVRRAARSAHADLLLDALWALSVLPRLLVWLARMVVELISAEVRSW